MNRQYMFVGDLFEFIGVLESGCPSIPFVKIHRLSATRRRHSCSPLPETQVDRQPSMNEDCGIKMGIQSGAVIGIVWVCSQLIFDPRPAAEPSDSLSADKIVTRT